MDGKKALEVDLRTAPVVSPARPRAVGLLPWWVAATAGLFGPALAAACVAIEPTPADPDAPVPLLVGALGYALVVTWLGAAVAGIARRPAALWWAAGGSALSVVLTVTCPTSGHHSAVAGWWVAELALCLSALFLTAAGLRWWAGRRAPAPSAV
jgi:hypothetical protein